MFAKLYNSLAIVSVATLLALGAFVGFLFGTGRVNAERLEVMAKVLRGELDDSATQAEAQPPGSEEEQPQEQTAASAEEIRQSRLQKQLRRAAFERAARDAAARQELAEQVLQRLVEHEERFKREKTAWIKQRETIANAARDAGFERELELFQRLAPKQAKEHLVRVWNKHPADAVRLLNAADTSKAQRILEQLKTPQEIEIMHELLERLRNQDVDELDPGSGTTLGG